MSPSLTCRTGVRLAQQNLLRTIKGVRCFRGISTNLFASSAEVINSEGRFLLTVLNCTPRLIQNLKLYIAAFFAYSAKAKNLFLRFFKLLCMAMNETYE